MFEVTAYYYGLGEKFTETAVSKSPKAASRLAQQYGGDADRLVIKNAYTGEVLHDTSPTEIDVSKTNIYNGENYVEDRTEEVAEKLRRQPRDGERLRIPNRRQAKAARHQSTRKVKSDWI